MACVTSTKAPDTQNETKDIFLEGILEELISEELVSLLCNIVLEKLTSNIDQNYQKQPINCNQSTTKKREGNLSARKEEMRKNTMWVSA